MTVHDDNNVVVTRSRYLYDDAAFGTATVGNLTLQRDRIGAAMHNDTAFTYDTYGNVLTQTDDNNNTTTYVYDQYNLYLKLSPMPKIKPLPMSMTTVMGR